MRQPTRAARFTTSSALTLALVTAGACVPSPTRLNETGVVVAGDPIQAPADDLQPLRLSLGGTEFVLTPRARYVLRGVVLGRERYRVGWQAKLAPYDVAIAWGPLAEKMRFRELDWFQDNRWYFWRYGRGFAHDNAFVYRHSANTHVIPASDTVARAIAALDFGVNAELAGILVDVGAERDGALYFWHTSLSRGDTGDGSCELLYLARLKIGREVWE